MNFATDLIEASAHRLAAPFLIVPEGPTVTYGDFWDRAGRMATVLAHQGAEPGDRVVARVDKSPDAIALYVACLMAGTVHVPLNPGFTEDELDYFIGDTDPAIVVVAPHLAAGVSDRHEVTVLSLGSEGDGTLADTADAADPTPPVERADDDLAALLYTSGTTGRPKGAALTHANLRLNGNALSEAWHFSPDDHLVHALPVFHVHGLFVALHCAMLSAIPVTFIPRFNARSVKEAILDATVMMGVPTHYNRLLELEDFDTAACADMRLFTAGSAPLPNAVFDEFTARTGHVICERYGMSETLITMSNPYDGDRLAGTVGFPVQGVEVRVADPTGEPLPAGSEGVVEIRGRQVMREYWRRPDATAESRRRDGWFITGDIGALDSEGRLILQGRANDMIISGGENVYPKEIELVLDELPGIAESAVVGLPHPDFGEAVTAVIVASADQPQDDTIDTALRSSLARFKHPKSIIRVDELPRNSMGKIQKKTLREEYADLYSAG